MRRRKRRRGKPKKTKIINIRTTREDRFITY
jgi:hypothetical protein